MKRKLALASLFISSTVSAQVYETFTTLSHENNNDVNSTGIEILHYVDGQERKGPLDVFDFINTSSLLGASYTNSDPYNDSAIFGEFQFGNGVFFGAGYDESDSKETSSATLGFQSKGLWSVAATAKDKEGSDTSIELNALYKHKLGGKDYLGFKYKTNDDTDFHKVGLKYYSALKGGQYLILEGDYTDYDKKDNKWSAGGTWYFDKMKSVFISVGSKDTQSIGGRYYFSKNWALAIDHTRSDKIDGSEWGIEITAQY